MRSMFRVQNKQGEVIEIFYKEISRTWVLMINGEVVKTSHRYKIVDAQARMLIGTYPTGTWKVVI